MPSRCVCDPFSVLQDLSLFIIVSQILLNATAAATALTLPSSLPHYADSGLIKLLFPVSAMPTSFLD